MTNASIFHHPWSFRQPFHGFFRNRGLEAGRKGAHGGAYSSSRQVPPAYHSKNESRPAL